MVRRIFANARDFIWQVFQVLYDILAACGDDIVDAACGPQFASSVLNVLGLVVQYALVLLAVVGGLFIVLMALLIAVFAVNEYRIAVLCKYRIAVLCICIVICIIAAIVKLIRICHASRVRRVKKSSKDSKPYDGQSF